MWENLFRERAESGENMEYHSHFHLIGQRTFEKFGPKMTLFKKVCVSNAAKGRMEASGKIYQGRKPPIESQGAERSPFTLETPSHRAV